MGDPAELAACPRCGAAQTEPTGEVLDSSPEYYLRKCLKCGAGFGITPKGRKEDFTEYVEGQEKAVTHSVTREEQAAFYDDFLAHFKEQQDNARNQGFREWIKKWIFQRKRVLDFGCSFGYNTQELQKDFGCEVYGIDLSPKCIEHANKVFSNCAWFCGDITNGFDPGVRDFDFVVMSDVIEHVPLERHDVLFKVLSSWTKVGGAILASVPNGEYHDTIQQQTYQPVEENIVIPDLLSTLARHGFGRIISVFLVGDLYYRMVIQKVSP